MVTRGSAQEFHKTILSQEAVLKLNQRETRPKVLLNSENEKLVVAWFLVSVKTNLGKV